MRWFRKKSQEPQKDFIIEQNGKTYNISKSKRLASSAATSTLFLSGRKNYFEVFRGGCVTDLTKDDAMRFWDLWDDHYVSYKEAFGIGLKEV